jgi:hypothetical protein
MLLRMKQEALVALIKSSSMTQLRLVVLRSTPFPSHRHSAGERLDDRHHPEPQDHMEKSGRIMLERTKIEREQLRAENLRLSHRISYLEEQVRQYFEIPKKNDKSPVKVSKINNWKIWDSLRIL